MYIKLNTMSENILEEYENTFRKNEDKIKNSLNKLELSTNNTAQDESPDNLLMDVSKLLKQQDFLLNQMRIEISNLNEDAQYKSHSSKLNSYKTALEQFKKNYSKLESKQLTDTNNIDMDNKNDLRNGLINNEQLAYAGHRKLQEAQRVLAGTEDVGNKIIGDLEEQTNQMRGVAVKIKTMNNDLDDSNNILNQMKKRVRSNKNILILLGVVLLVILIAVIAFKLLL